MSDPGKGESNPGKHARGEVASSRRWAGHWWDNRAVMFRGPADQRRFWTGRWHEREVDAHVAAGEVAVHADGEALLRHLDQLDAGADSSGP